MDSKYKDLKGIDIPEKFTNCQLGNYNISNRIIAVNEKYLAMLWEGDKKIKIVDSSCTMNINDEIPCLNSENNIMDLEFSPFHNNLLASSTANKSVLLWKIPENGINENNINEKAEYTKHNNKVFFVNFNPVVSDVICSCCLNGEIHVWNQNILFL